MALSKQPIQPSLPAEDARRVLTSGITRWVFVLMALPGLVACDFIDPAATGGEVMLVLDGLDCGDSRPMAFSPNGEYLLFNVVRHHQGAGSPEKKLGVLRLDDGKVFFAESADEATSAMLSTGRFPPFPHTEGICWSDDETAHFPISPIHGKMLDDLGRSRGFQAGDDAVDLSESNSGIDLSRSLPKLKLQPDANNNTLVVAPAGMSDASATAQATASSVGYVLRLSQPSRLALAPVPAECSTPPQGEWSYSSWTFGSLDHPDIPVERRFKDETVLNSDKTIRLVTQDGRILAKHKTQYLRSSQIALKEFDWNPQGSRLAYLLSESRGSFLSGPSRLWLYQSAQSEPMALATGMYSLQWQDDRTLFSCGNIPDVRERGIVPLGFAGLNNLAAIAVW